MTSTTSAAVYDDFVGPGIDTARWMHLELPLPDGTMHRAAEPDAVTEASNGTLTVNIDQFRTSHDSFQSIDNAKHILVSTAEFALPPAGTANFEIEQSTRRTGAPDLNHLHGLAVFHVLDFATGLMFDIAAADHQVFAIHERFDSDPTAPTLFTHMVEDPFRLTTQAGQRHRLRITFDTAARAVTWSVDDTVIYRIDGAELPTAVRLGLGVLTGIKLTDKGSGSCQGQGVHASWSSPTIVTSP